MGTERVSEPLVSLAMFGAVAMVVTGMHRQASSSEDLGTSGFDDDQVELERYVESIPKVELHVHLDGSFDPHQLWKHLEQNPHLLKCFPVEKKLPWEKPDAPPLPLRQMVETCQSPLDYRRLCTCRRRYRSLRHSDDGKKLNRGKSPPGTLEDMLTCFEFFFPLVYDNYELIEHLAYDFVMRQHEQNVIYTEVRYSPHLLSKDAVKAFEAVTRGLRKGCQKYKRTVNQILCAINFCPQWSDDIVEMAVKYRNDFPCAVVGIDVAAGENHFAKDSPLRQGHYDMCQKAKKLGVNITIHAGETPNSAGNVRLAIEEYGATRIGHGYHITDSPEILQLVKSKKIHMEVCPTSSVETGGWVKTEWKQHPACLFKEKGIELSLSSDDPAVFNTSLTWQYRIALKKMGWEESDIFASLNNAISASFLPDDEKEKFRRMVKECKVHDNPIFTDRVHYD